MKATNISRLYNEMFKGNQVYGQFDQVGSLVLPREEKAAGTPWRPWLWLPSLVRAAACVQTRQGGQTPPDTCITALTAVHCIDELKYFMLFRNGTKHWIIGIRLVIFNIK